MLMNMKNSRLKNRYVLMTLAALIGGAINLNLITALAYLLSILPAVYSVYAVVVSALLFTALLKYVRLTGVKYARYAALMFFVFGTASIALPYISMSEFLYATSWLLLAMFARLFFKWILTDLTIRHLNPAEAKSYFAYTASSYEVGTLGVMLFIQFSSGLSPQWVTTSVGIAAFVMSGLLLGTLARANRMEIRFHKTPDHQEGLYSHAAFSKLLKLMITVSLLFGLFEMMADFSVKVMLKEALGDFHTIREIIARAYIASSAILIFMLLFSGNWIKQKRVSPIKLYGVYIAINICAAVFVLWEPSVFRVVVFYTVFMVTLKAFYMPSTQLLLSYFPPIQRQKLHASYNFFYWVVPNVMIAVCASYVDGLGFDEYRNSLLLGLLVVGCCVLALLLVFKAFLIRFFYNAVFSERKAPAIFAVDALSYLNPKDFSKQMLRLLSQNPKKLLRKTVILGLGGRGDEAAKDAIIKEFRSDKEEIQIAVLQSMMRVSSYQQITFIIDVLLHKQQALTSEVRINATQVLARIYGKKAIPILLFGLDTEEDRLKANIIETLDTFHTASLIPVFKRYVDSPTHRLKGNALMALLSFRRTRVEARDELKSMLNSDDPNSVASALYAVAVKKDRSFLPLIKELYQRREMIKKPIVRRGLAFCFSMLEHPMGMHIFIHQLHAHYRQETNARGVIHFFAKLPQRIRFQLLERIATYYGDERGFIAYLFNVLKDVPYDHHEEIDFMFAQIDG